MARARYSDMVTRADALGVDASGMECLAVAIFDQTARDLRRLKATGKTYMHHMGDFISVDEIDAFFQSAWCEILLGGTSWTPEEVRARI